MLYNNSLPQAPFGIVYECFNRALADADIALAQFFPKPMAVSIIELLFHCPTGLTP